VERGGAKERGGWAAERYFVNRIAAWDFKNAQKIPGSKQIQARGPSLKRSPCRGPSGLGVTLRATHGC
jgi:hypothetical protein